MRPKFDVVPIFYGDSDIVFDYPNLNPIGENKFIEISTARNSVEQNTQPKNRGQIIIPKEAFDLNTPRIRNSGPSDCKEDIPVGLMDSSESSRSLTLNRKRNTFFKNLFEHSNIFAFYSSKNSEIFTLLVKHG